MMKIGRRNIKRLFFPAETYSLSIKRRGFNCNTTLFFFSRAFPPHEKNLKKTQVK